MYYYSYYFLFQKVTPTSDQTIPNSSPVQENTMEEEQEQEQEEEEDISKVDIIKKKSNKNKYQSLKKPISQKRTKIDENPEIKKLPVGEKKKKPNRDSIGLLNLDKTIKDMIESNVSIQNLKIKSFKNRKIGKKDKKESPNLIFTDPTPSDFMKHLESHVNSEVKKGNFFRQNQVKIHINYEKVKEIAKDKSFEWRSICSNNTPSQNAKEYLTLYIDPSLLKSCNMKYFIDTFINPLL